MTDTYKGESIGKKCARAALWLSVRRYSGPEFYAGKILILASREGGDAASLLSLGVCPRHIIAVERDPLAGKAFAQRFPDVPLIIGELSDVVRTKDVRGQLIAAHLDFCSWLTPDALATAAAVCRFGMVDKGLLSLGTMKGRESSGEHTAIQEFDHWWDGDRLLSVAARAIPATGTRAGYVRAQRNIDALVTELSANGPPVYPMIAGQIEYNSGRTPMLFTLASVHRSPSWRWLIRGIRQEFERMRTPGWLQSRNVLPWVMNWWCATGKRLGREITPLPLNFGRAAPDVALTVSDLAAEVGVDAAGLLNVSVAKLAAWRAHATRGTYKRAG